MEQVAKRRKHSPLRKSFFEYVIVTFLLIAVLSGGAILCCSKIQNVLLPENEQCILTVEKTYDDGTVETYSYPMEMGTDDDSLPAYISNEGTENRGTKSVKYSVTPFGNDPSSLTPKRKLLYHFCDVATIAIPILLSLLGILLCGIRFYKNRLLRPIDILSEGADHIADQDLDFSISYGRDDEFGELCSSFETMRKSLAENHQKMWKMATDRKKMQVSIAHDLRNPITIIKGYAEFLKINIPQGQVDQDKALEIADKIEKAAKRMESYTESVREANYLEELVPNNRKIRLDEYIHNLSLDMNKLCQGQKLRVTVINQLPDLTVSMDGDMLSRIIENLVSNGMRFAANEITISFSMEEEQLLVEISDDGCGFSQDSLLRGKDEAPFVPSQDGHLGMGLYICQTLCKKMDGQMTLGNRPDSGAYIKLAFSI